MATQGALHTITPQMAAFASALIRETNRGTKSLLRGVEKAEPRLFELGWEVSGGILLIQSATRPGKVWETDGDDCQCPATGKHCWHRSAWLIICTCQAASVAPLAHKHQPIHPGAALLTQPTTHLHEEDIPGHFLDDVPSALWNRDHSIERIEEQAAERRLARATGPSYTLEQLEALANELL